MRALFFVLPAFAALPVFAADARVDAVTPSFPTATGEVAIDEDAFVSAFIDDGEVVPGQYIVVLKDSRALKTLAGRHRLEQVRVLGPQRAVVVKGVSPVALRMLRNDRDVAYVEPDGIARIVARPGPSTPPPPELNPPGIDRVGSDEITNTGVGATVCVVDTGIDWAHLDLAANYVGGQDFVNNDTNAMDDNGHGTHCAGTIAAKDDEQGVIGVAPGASLRAAKVLNRRGSGSYSGIIAGVNYCVQQNVDVISMSLGGSSSSQTFLDSLIAAKAAGVTIVVAAGNEGANLDVTKSYPAAYDGTVITVSAASVGETARALGTPIGWASFSNYGSAVDLAAPGVSVLSDKSGGGTTSMSGTSMATPHVAGGAALYIAANPGATPDQVEAALESSAEDVTNTATHPEELLNVRSFVAPTAP